MASGYLIDPVQKTAGGDISISPGSIVMQQNLLPSPSAPVLHVPDADDPTLKTVTTDMWSSSTFDYSNIITMVGNEEIQIAVSGSAVYPLLTALNEAGDPMWIGENGADYNFKASASADGAAWIQPGLAYYDPYRSSWYLIASGNAVELNESNGFADEISFSVHFSGSPLQLALCFNVIDPAFTGQISMNAIEFSRDLTGHIAEAWSVDNNLPGLGLNVNISDGYILKTGDGTTYGLTSTENTTILKGVNTSVSSISIPEGFFVGEDYRHISTVDVNDWSGAPAVTAVTVPSSVNSWYKNVENSSITDVYVSSEMRFNTSMSNTRDVYLHLPYGFSRDVNMAYNFTRVLIGDETPEYPVPTVSEDFVIKGENEDEYFAIHIQDSGNFAISEIFTSNESVTLPQATPYTNGLYWIKELGADDYYFNVCDNSPALRSITIPACYSALHVDYYNFPVTDLHFLGNPPQTDYDVPSGLNVYIASQDKYGLFAISQWGNANLIPDGWDFEWMTVDVKRPGEFAQTYIEMTDANWSQGLYVKVTGKLGEGDLKNMHNLASVIKLDLSEAEFTTLPSGNYSSDGFMRNHPTLEEVSLPATVSEIPAYSFKGAARLKKVSAPGVLTIQSYAFDGCSSLTGLDISDVRYIGDYAFNNCNQYVPGSFNEQLTYIGSYAFCSTSIEEAMIPKGMSQIKTDAFANCTSLRKVSVPSTVQQIDSYAFSGCVNLAEVILSEGLVQIAGSAFSNCSSLSEITLPATLSRVDYRAFNYCSGLQSVKCRAVTPPACSGTFTEGIDMNHCTLYVATLAVDYYRNATGWSNFFIMKPLQEPLGNIYVTRPMAFNLLSEDNALLAGNPNIVLSYTSNGEIGQLYAEGDGTLSAGMFRMYHQFMQRNNYRNDRRTTLINDAENMRADNVATTITFSTGTWHFISFPYDVQMSDITPSEGTDFAIREYDSAGRAAGNTGNWKDVPADGVLQAGKGYIIQAANNIYQPDSYSTYPAVIDFPSRNTTSKNNLFTSTNVIVPLEEFTSEFAHNRSWNLVGNPYPCYYSLSTLMEDFTAPVTIWRGSSYQAYSPVDDDLILRPNEAFFVQRPLDAESMVFAAEGRMNFEAGTASGFETGAKAPANVSGRYVFNFNLEGCGADDRARIVINEQAQAGYEPGRDAAKFFVENGASTAIYTRADALYDICERPLGDAVATLGACFAADGEYTISLSGRGLDGWSVILTDCLTGISTDLTEGAYTFTATAGDAADRFSVAFKAPSSLGVEALEGMDAETLVRVYDMTGLLVFKGILADFKAENAGIYIVVTPEYTRKVIVKK